MLLCNPFSFAYKEEHQLFNSLPNKILDRQGFADRTQILTKLMRIVVYSIENIGGKPENTGVW